MSALPRMKYVSSKHTSSPSNLAIEPAVANLKNSSNPSKAALQVVVLARKAAIALSSPAPLPILPPANTLVDLSESEFTASPSRFATSSLLNPSSRTSFIPSSPSWLSRNVQRLSFHLSTFKDISTDRIGALKSQVPESAHISLLHLSAPQPFYAPESPYRPVLQRVVANIYLETPGVDRDSLATPRFIAESSSSTSSIIKLCLCIGATLTFRGILPSVIDGKDKFLFPLRHRADSGCPNSQELPQSLSSRKHFSPSSNTLNLSVPTSLSPLPSENSLNLHAHPFLSQAQDSVPPDLIFLPKDLTTLFEILRPETGPPPNRQIMDYTRRTLST
ncbi:hypothetical protein P692DRAFT_20877398 [Suillus brevipes Sb2]|nr:hypothetical protein P692DRAFT_20877398 [Suillus brevipes Sb2]